MTWEAAVAVLLGGGLLGSLVSWWTTRHRPKVDRAEVVMTGQASLLDDIREERDRLDQRIDKVEARAVTAESRALAADRRATEAEELTAYAVAQNSAAIDLYLATVRGVHAGTIPPWLPTPPLLADRISDADLPDPDTGVPGT